MVREVSPVMRKAHRLPAIALLVGVALVTRASAQLGLPAGTQTAVALQVRGVSAAHDKANNHFLIVGAYTHVTAVLTDANGTPVLPQIVIKPLGTVAKYFFPRVAYSAAINGGQGGFLVLWAEQDPSGASFLHTRLVSASGVLLGSELKFTDARTWADVGGSAMAYSATSRLFLVAWKGRVTTNEPFRVRVQRIALDNTLVGASFLVAAATGSSGEPGVAWNSDTNDFGVSLAGELDNGADYLAFVKVPAPAANGAAFNRTTFNMLAVGQARATDISYNLDTKRYLMSWWEASNNDQKARVAEIDASGAVLGVGMATTNLGTYDSVSNAYNPLSGTTLLVGLQGSTDDVLAAELNAHGVRISPAQDLQIYDSPAPVAPSTESLYPARYTRVATSLSGPRWLSDFGKKFAAGLAQSVNSSTTGGGGGGTYPPPDTPPPPPPTTACSDGIDNDGDSKIDMADPGCSGPSDTTEANSTTTACSDGIDNDGDSKVDMADPGCSSSSDTTEADSPPPPPGTCTSPKPAADWVCMNGGWRPPGYPGTGTAACPTPKPTTGTWICVNGNWQPAGIALPTCTGANLIPKPPDSGWIRTATGNWLPPGYPTTQTLICIAP
jgi:hypothetical protein